MTSWPRCTEIFLTALAMLSTAISRNPAATSSGARPSPISSASRAKPARTAAASSGSSPWGPKTEGKCAGWIRPSITLASVTVSGPSRR